MVALRKVPKRSVADGVFEQLKDAITGGALPPGDPLPSERHLSVQLGVGRSAVREALVRLEQVGLIVTRHGDTTRVQDYRVSAGLDLLPALLIDASGKPNAAVLRACLEMRAAIAPDVCRLCAVRSSHAGEAMLQVAGLMANQSDLAALRGLNVRFWQAAVLGCQNVAYQLAYNSLRKAFDLSEQHVLAGLSLELRNHAGFVAIARAISSGNGEEAALRTREHIQAGLTTTLHAVAGLGPSTI